MVEEDTLRLKDEASINDISLTKLTFLHSGKAIPLSKVSYHMETWDWSSKLTLKTNTSVEGKREYSE